MKKWPASLLLFSTEDNFRQTLLIDMDITTALKILGNSLFYEVPLYVVPTIFRAVSGGL